MTTVVHCKRENHAPNYVYIGRPSKWGNPFEIGKTSIDCVFAVPAERCIRHDQVGSIVHVEDPYGPQARQRTGLRRHARTPRRKRRSA